MVPGTNIHPEIFSGNSSFDVVASVLAALLTAQSKARLKHFNAPYCNIVGSCWGSQKINEYNIFIATGIIEISQYVIGEYWSRSFSLFVSRRKNVFDGLNGVNRQPSNVLKINRQPSNKKKSSLSALKEASHI